MVEIIPENIREDNELSQAEKETNILFEKTTDEVFVHSSEGGIMRRLIQHPLFTVTNVTEKDGSIVSVKGRLPIGVLSIGSKERKHGGHASIVTNGVMNKDENANIDLE